MLSSALVVALLGFVNADSAQGPTWMTDYQAAKEHAKERSKPLAVFVGKGERGWTTWGGPGRLRERCLRFVARDTPVCLWAPRRPVERELWGASNAKHGVASLT